MSPPTHDRTQLETALRRAEQEQARRHEQDRNDLKRAVGRHRQWLSRAFTGAVACLCTSVLLAAADLNTFSFLSLLAALYLAVRIGRRRFKAPPLRSAPGLETFLPRSFTETDRQ